MDAGTFSAINTCWKFADFCIKLRDVRLESRVFLRLITRVRTDLDQAFLLMRHDAVKAHFANDPHKEEYVVRCIADTKTALASIGYFVESVRVDEERNGSISLMNKFEWVLRHQSKLQTRQLELATCHTSLGQAVGAMRLWEMNPLLPSYATATMNSSERRREEVVDEESDAEGWEAPQARRLRMKEVKNLSQIDLTDSSDNFQEVISPGTILEAEKVADGFANAAMPPPTRSSTEVFMSRIDIPPVKIEHAPRTGRSDGKPKLPVPFPFNMDDESSASAPPVHIPQEDEKPKTLGGWPTDARSIPTSSTTQRVPPTIEALSDDPPPLYQQKMARRSLPPSTTHTPAADSQHAAMPHAGIKAHSVPAELPGIVPPTWSSDNRAQPGWEVFIPELDSTPLRLVQSQSPTNSPTELEVPSRPALHQFTSDPGPAPYLTELSATPIISTPPVLGLTRYLRPQIPAHSQQHNPTWPPAPGALLEARTAPRRLSAPRPAAQSSSWANAAVPLLSASPKRQDRRASFTDRRQQPAMSQDSDKEVHLPLAAPTRPAPPPPVPPKIPEWDSTEEVATPSRPLSGAAGKSRDDDTMKVFIPPWAAHLDKGTADTSKIVIAPGVAWDSNNSPPPRDGRVSPLLLTAEDMARKEAIRRRRAARDLFLGSDD